MAGGQKNVAALVYGAVKKPIEDLGYSIWDLEYVKEGTEWYLRITVDSEKGVDIDDCEKVIRLVDPIVTDLDPIEDSYHLEVSSPGLERDLRTAEHYRWAVGKTVRLRLFTAVNGSRELLGELLSLSGNGDPVLGTDAGEVTVEKKKISKANLYFDFDAVDMSVLDESDGEEYEEAPEECEESE